MRELVARGLATEYAVYEAEDGQIALEMLPLLPPLVAIVCDIMMPRVDGITFAKKLKADSKLKATPILFLTAKTSPLEVIEGINAGARHYLTKPFKIKELIEKVIALEGRK